MKRITIGLGVALLTFTVSITVTAVWLSRVTQPVTVDELPAGADPGGDLSPEWAEALRHVPWDKSLVERLNLFTAYQRTGRWDEVAELLGEFKGVPGRDPYTEEQKMAVLRRLRRQPILAFRPQCTTYSTEILGRPLEQRWWSINGVAESTENGARVEMGSEIIAYRHRGDWYFFPGGGDASTCPR